MGQVLVLNHARLRAALRRDDVFSLMLHPRARGQRHDIVAQQDCFLHPNPIERSHPLVAHVTPCAGLKLIEHSNRDRDITRELVEQFELVDGVEKDQGGRC